MPGPAVWTGGSGSTSYSKAVNVTDSDESSQSGASSYQDTSSACANEDYSRQHARDFKY
jgi:hypothetical protein